MTFVRILLILVLAFASPALAQKPQQKEASFATQVFLLAEHYADRVEALERRIEELTAKCGDRCTPPIPPPPAAPAGEGK